MGKMTLEDAYAKARAEVMAKRMTEGRARAGFGAWTKADYIMLADLVERYTQTRGIEDELTVDGFSYGVDFDAQWLR